MPWWVLVALVAIGAVAWAYVQGRSRLEGRQDNSRRRRKVTEVASDAVEGRLAFLRNRPVWREEPYHLTDAEFKIDRGE